MNEEKYSVNENDSMSSSSIEKEDEYLEEEFFKPREEGEKELKRGNSQVKYRPKRTNSRKRSHQKKRASEGKHESSMSMDIKRPPVDRTKMKAESRERRMKRSRSKKRSKRNSVIQEELPKISANINDIALEERHTTNTRNTNKSRPSNKNDFKELFDSSRRKKYSDIKKKVFSKSNGNKNKHASSKEKVYMYSTNQSFKKGNSLRNWKKNLEISTDSRKENNDLTTSPPRYSKNYSKTQKNKETKTKTQNFLSKMLKRVIKNSTKNAGSKSPRMNFRKDVIGNNSIQHKTAQSYNTPTYSYFSNNGSSRRKSSKDKKNQFFTNPNYSLSVNTSKVAHRRNYSKQDFVTYIDSPLYLIPGAKTTKPKDYKIREMSYDTGNGNGKNRQKSKKRVSSRQKRDKIAEAYKSKKMNVRNMKLRNKIGALRNKME